MSLKSGSHRRLLGVAVALGLLLFLLVAIALSIVAWLRWQSEVSVESDGAKILELQREEPPGT